MKRNLSFAFLVLAMAIVPVSSTQAAWYGTVIGTYNNGDPLAYQSVEVKIMVNRHDSPITHKCEALIAFEDLTGRSFNVSVASNTNWN